MNFEFIDKCYEVEEQHLRSRYFAGSGYGAARRPCTFRSNSRPSRPRMREDFDWVVWATYGLGPSRGIFKSAKYQVAEKILIELPAALHHLSLVVVDGPFTAFDPYGSSTRSLFGSAKTYEPLDDNRSQGADSGALRQPAEPARLGTGELYALRCDEKGFGAGRAGIDSGEVCGVAVHDSRGRKQSQGRSQDAVCAGWRAGGIAHFFRKGRERGEGGAACLREDCREQLNRARA